MWVPLETLNLNNKIGHFSKIIIIIQKILAGRANEFFGLKTSEITLFGLKTFDGLF